MLHYAFPMENRFSEVRVLSAKAIVPHFENLTQLMPVKELCFYSLQMLICNVAISDRAHFALQELRQLVQYRMCFFLPKQPQRWPRTSVSIYPSPTGPVTHCQSPLRYTWLEQVCGLRLRLELPCTSLSVTEGISASSRLVPVPATWWPKPQNCSWEVPILYTPYIWAKMALCAAHVGEAQIRAEWGDWVSSHWTTDLFY